MTFPTAIAFHGVDASDALRAEVLERVKGLERFVDDILACRVEIQVASHGRRSGGHYGVHIRLAMPCIEIEAGGRATADADEDDPYLTVANTFDALNCQIEDFVRRRCKSCSRYTASHW
ncbi:MAG TPA: HPF/RaiA family ribosome-associated protein [Rudaea sp.]|nr:HPF/RaiA family ribosome-associated protein [Rudaea sp.]